MAKATSRRATAPATTPAAPPSTRSSSSRRRSATSGLAAAARPAAACRGSASTPSATCSSTCRGATTTCARCARSASSVGRRGRRRWSRARARSATSGSSPTFRRPRPADDRDPRPTRPASVDATWFGRRFIERRLRVGQRGRRVGQGQAVRRQPRVSTTRSSRSRRRRDRAPPRRPDRAGLPADGRADRARLRAAIREALDRAGAAYPEYLPGRDPATRRLVLGIARGDRGGALPGDRSRAATRPSAGWPSTSCSRSSWAWSAGAASAAASRGRGDRVDDDADARRSGRPSPARTRRAGRRRPIELTDDQVVAIDAIRTDLARPTPMLRLLQGDVGSGKTRGRGVCARGGRRAGLPGRAPRPDRPARAPAPRDRQRAGPTSWTAPTFSSSRTRTATARRTNAR